MKKISVFDFDGTITTKDTLFEFMKFTHGKYFFYLKFIVLFPIIILYLFKILPNYKAKQIIFNSFYKGMKIDAFNKKGILFIRIIEMNLNEKVIKQLKQSQANGNEIIIVSASIENWIIPWANSHNINHILGTQIEVVNGVLTGNFSTKNCYGKEKVERLKKFLSNKEQYYIYAYGDSKGDVELLDFAHEAYWVKNINK